MAETEVVQQSWLNWFFSSLGFGYALLLPAVALICFVLTLIVVIRGRGPMAAAAIVLVVPTPFLIGIVAGLRGGIASYAVIAMSSTPPKPAEVAAGISTALIAPFVGLLLMAPSYLVAVAGTLIRSILIRGLGEAGESAHVNR
jgi:hypothetical protein